MRVSTSAMATRGVKSSCITPTSLKPVAMYSPGLSSGIR